MDRLAEVGGAQAFADGLGEGKDVEALRQVGFHPSGELGSAAGVFLDGGGQFGLGRA